MTIKSLVLSTTGRKYPIMIGSLKKCIEEKILDFKKLEYIYGVSGGSLIGMCICLKYTISEITSIMYAIDYNKIKKIHIKNIFKTFSLDDGSGWKSLLRSLIAIKLGNFDATLKDLYEYSGIELNVIVSCIELEKYDVISYKTHADLPIWKVIFASSSIPFIFPPIKLDGKYNYVDGGFFHYFPYELAHKKPVLGIDVSTSSFVNEKTKRPIEDCNLIDYINNLMNFLIVGKITKYVKKDKNVDDIIIRFYLPNDKSEFYINITNEEKQKMEMIGRIETEKTIKKYREKLRFFIKDFVEQIIKDVIQHHNKITENTTMV